MLAGRNPLSLGIMMVLVGLLTMGIWQKAKRTEVTEEGRRIMNTAHELEALRIAAEAFARDCGRFPSTEQGLAALVRNPGVPGWKGPYVPELKPDGWNHDYGYWFQHNVALLLSAGSDGAIGTPDDIREVDFVTGETNAPGVGGHAFSVDVDPHKR